MFSIGCNSRVKFWRNKKNPQKIAKIKPFTNKYNWEGIHFPSEKDDWENFERNTATIALNVLHV